jgi:nitrite reductase/ring-hydroxylating ferredoxin subunit
VRRPHAPGVGVASNDCETRGARIRRRGDRGSGVDPCAVEVETDQVVLHEPASVGRAQRAALFVAPGPDQVGQHVGQWHDVMATTDLAPGAVTRIDCDGRGRFVHHADDGWKVFDSRCPHQTTNIPHLALAGRTPTCPKHQRACDIRSGQCSSKGDTPLKRWDTKLADARLWARW